MTGAEDMADLKTALEETVETDLVEEESDDPDFALTKGTR